MRGDVIEYQIHGPGESGSRKKEDEPMKYVCTVCGYVYDEEEEGVKFEDLPDDYVCPLCGVGKEDFEAEE